MLAEYVNDRDGSEQTLCVSCAHREHAELLGPAFSGTCSSCGMCDGGYAEHIF